MARTTTEMAIVGGPTIESTRDYWVLRLKSEGRAERTISIYLNALRRLDEFLASGGMPRELRAIRPERLQAWIGDVLERNQPGPVSISFRTVRPFFRWLVDEDETTVPIPEGAYVELLGLGWLDIEDGAAGLHEWDEPPMAATVAAQKAWEASRKRV